MGEMERVRGGREGLVFPLASFKPCFTILVSVDWNK